MDRVSSLKDCWIGVRYDFTLPGVPAVVESITFDDEMQIHDYAEGEGLWIVWPHNGEGHPEDDMTKEVCVDRYDYLPAGWFPKDAAAYFKEIENPWVPQRDPEELIDRLRHNQLSLHDKDDIIHWLQTVVEQRAEGTVG